jgi:hypothetical protein
MTTYYIDYNRGNDASADPTNQATPWKELTKIKTISATAGDQFLLADDSEWNYTMADVAVTGINWTGTKDNPVIIGKYSPSGTPSSAKPTIRWGNDIAANEWTYSAPNNAWSYTPGGGITVSKLGLVQLGDGEMTAQKQLSDAFPLPSENGVFNVVTTVFWLYAPAGTDPTTYYGGVRLSAKQNGGFFNLGYNARAVTVRDILFKDSGSCIHMFSGAGQPNQYITVDSCDGLKISSMVQCIPDGDDNANLVVKNCNVTGWGSNCVWVYDNHHWISSFEAYNNTFTDGNYSFGQGGIYIQAKCRRAHIHHNKFSYARYGGIGNTLDGCGMYVDIGTRNLVVSDNEISHCYIGLQDGSDWNTVYRNNYVHHCKLGMMLGTTGAATDWAIVVENNTFVTGYAIVPVNGSKSGTGLYHWHTATDVLTSEYIRNNVFVNVGESDDTTGAAILLRDTYVPTTLDMSNNSYYGYTYEVMSYPSLTPEATPPNTVTADPELDSNGHPQDGSPLIGAGVHTGYTVDARRSQRWNPPTIGAYEYQRARTARL